MLRRGLQALGRCRMGFSTKNPNYRTSQTTSCWNDSELTFLQHDSSNHLPRDANQIKRGFVLQNRIRSKQPKLLEKEFARIDEKLFLDKSISKMVALEFAFLEYQKVEPRVKVVDSYKDPDQPMNDILYVNIQGFGPYLFKSIQDQQVIQMTSPKSGVWKYYYDPTNDRWNNNKETHVIDEILLREITKECNGGFSPS